MKFLVINHPKVPVPKRAPIEGCVDYFTRFVARKQATVYPMVGPKSYATIIDVASGEELNKVLSDNPMAPNEEVLDLSTIRPRQYPGKWRRRAGNNPVNSSSEIERQSTGN